MFKEDKSFDSKLTEVERRKIYLSHLGVSADEILNMKSLFRADLDIAEFGIKWWKTRNKAEKHSSVLAADYLFQLSESIIDNLVESHIHFSEFKTANEKPNLYLTERERQHNRGVSTIMRRDTLNDFYKDDLAKSHLIGIFRGIGSVIDCWLATFILASGLKIPVWECRLKLLYERKKSLEKLPSLSSSEQYEMSSITRFLEVLSRHSPEGWGPWVESIRNMYVHKGRLRTTSMGTPKPMPIKTIAGETLYSVQETTFLPKHPELSEVESLLSSTKENPIDLGVDIDVFCNESISTISEISKHLANCISEIWNERRNGIEELQYFPLEQWPKRKKSRLSFEGYTNRSTIKPRERFLAEEAVVRMRAAALDDEYVSFWDP